MIQWLATIIIISILQPNSVFPWSYISAPTAFMMPEATLSSPRIVLSVSSSSTTSSLSTESGSGSSNKKGSTSSSKTKTDGDNKAMAFLKKIGKVGGTKVDFTNAIGVDEGVSGGKEDSSSARAGKWDHDIALKKSNHAYQSCTESGVIDDLSESFPITSSGTTWAGVTDKNFGGVSSGTLVRQDFNGRLANVLTANVRLKK